MGENLEKIRAAMKSWADSKGVERKVWLDMIADDFRFETVSDADGLPAAKGATGPQLLMNFFDGLLKDWRMDSYTPRTFLEDGEYVAMFGECTYTFKATGKPVTTPIANLWHFRNGKIWRVMELIDSAHAAKAMVPG